MTVGDFNHLHAALGIAGEAGEIVDVIKKHVIYGKREVGAELIEEMGDLFWYLAILCRGYGIDFRQIMYTNIEKLKERYPDGKWTAEDALAKRDKQ